MRSMRTCCQVDGNIGIERNDKGKTRKLEGEREGKHLRKYESKNYFCKEIGVSRRLTPTHRQIYMNR